MKVGIISLKGGVGKTFLAVNLATYLAREHNKKVLLVDLSGETANTALYIRKKPLILGERLWQGIVATPYFHLKVASNIREDHNRDLEVLEKIYDFIIFDTPPHFGVIKLINEWADVLLLVTNSDYLSLFTNYVLYKYLNKDKVKIILNKYSKEIDLDIINSIYGKPVSVVIPYSKDVIKANKLLIPLVLSNPNSKVTGAIDDIAYLLTSKKKKRNVILEIIKSIFLA